MKSWLLNSRNQEDMVEDQTCVAKDGTIHVIKYLADDAFDLQNSAQDEKVRASLYPYFFSMKEEKRRHFGRQKFFCSDIF